MSPFTVLVLCIQACLIQSAVSQQFGCGGCGGSSGYSLGYSQPRITVSQPLTSFSQAGAGSCGSSYGGQGTGTVAAVGDVIASGTTCVTGAVPVIGQVSFCGTAPASGSVSISGQCGCDCPCY